MANDFSKCLPRVDFSIEKPPLIERCDTWIWKENNQQTISGRVFFCVWVWNFSQFWTLLESNWEWKLMELKFKETAIFAWLYTTRWPNFPQLPTWRFRWHTKGSKEIRPPFFGDIFLIFQLQKSDQNLLKKQKVMAKKYWKDFFRTTCNFLWI